MKSKTTVALLICLLWSFGLSTSESWGFSITTPLPKTRTEAGSIVRVNLDAGDVKALRGVMFTAYGDYGKILGAHFAVQPPFQWTLQLPPDYTGPAAISATGNLPGIKTGNSPESTVTIYITLPASVVLQTISVRDDQKQFMMRPYATRKLSVYGQYSDGLEREVSAESSGTSYSSSNKTVALVGDDGVVTARGPGKAQITARNGKHEVVVNVTVQLKP